jgi:hypothetical protein
MFRCSVLKALMLLLVSPCCLFSQVTVFDNSETYSGKFARIGDEYGDEVILAGQARVLTKIKFEYFADFFANFDERAQLRIYANSGPAWKGNSDYPLVAEKPLWESTPFIIRSGLHTQEVPIPSIVVPDRFTWTVQFSGFSMQTGVITLDPNVTNDFAGLLFYGLATVGITYNDFWERLPVLGWTPVTVPGVYKNNFGARITAIPEAISPTLSIRRDGSRLDLIWPKTSAKYFLQWKTNLFTDWTNVPHSWVTGAQTVETTLYDIPDQNLFFRLRYAPPTVPDLTITEENGATRIGWSAVPETFVLQSRASSTSQWVDIDTPVVPGPGGFSVLVRGIEPERSFRLRETLYAAKLEVIRSGPNLKLRWPRLAIGYIVQSKPTIGSQSWATVSEQTVTDGEFLEIQTPISGEARIFRLKQ